MYGTYAEYVLGMKNHLAKIWQDFIWQKSFLQCIVFTQWASYTGEPLQMLQMIFAVGLLVDKAV